MWRGRRAVGSGHDAAGTPRAHTNLRHRHRRRKGQQRGRHVHVHTPAARRDHAHDERGLCVGGRGESGRVVETGGEAVAVFARRPTGGGRVGHRRARPRRLDTEGKLHQRLVQQQVHSAILGVSIGSTSLVVLEKDRRHWNFEFIFGGFNVQLFVHWTLNPPKMNCPKPNGWSIRAVARSLGLPHSTVAQWIASGLVEPVSRARGRVGYCIGWRGLLEVLAVRDLRSAGFLVQDIHRAVKNVREMMDQEHPLVGITLVIVGDDVLVRSEDDSYFSALRRPTQRVMVFPIGNEHAQLVAVLTDESEQTALVIESA